MKSLYILPLERDIEILEIERYFLNILKKTYQKIAFFSPICFNKEILKSIKEEFELDIDIDKMYCFDNLIEIEKLLSEDENKLFETIIDVYENLLKEYDFILISGFFEEKFDFLLEDINLYISKNLNSPIVPLVKFTDINILKIIHHKIICSNNIHLSTLVLNKKQKDIEEKYPIYYIENIKYIENYIDSDFFIDKFKYLKMDILTPLRFRYKIFQKAKIDKKKIALCELDDRILKAVDIILKRDIVDIIFIGDKKKYQKRAKELKLDISKATFFDDKKENNIKEKLVEDFFQLRREKGITITDAREIIYKNITYLSTMLVAYGYADGLVSGASHTTADSVKPALEILRKTKDTLVSSIFLMAMDTKILIFGDCAINIDPSSYELATIAIDSYNSALKFGIDPRVALLSYSTGDSGKGKDVEKVKKALQIVKKKYPNILIDGPIQYDAAVDKKVAKLKFPNSLVAGRATVFIFPDLDTGNITYKAVQRSSGAIAIGPIIQGLKKPINDLSRGCSVEDIINTIAITAIQAQEE